MYPRITDWLSIMGSFSSGIIVVLIPGLIFAKAFKSEKPCKRVFVLVWAVTVFIVFEIAAVTVFLKMTGVYKEF